jgi:hypothetical protein
MANLISVTVLKDTPLITAGVKVLNTFKIKKVQTKPTGALIYYAEGQDKQSVVYKILVSDSATTVNNSLTGSLDFALAVNSIQANGTTIVESIKTYDILLAQVDPSNANQSIVWMCDVSLQKTKLTLNNILASLVTAANNYSLATIDATPTSGSANAVQSGGVYTALATKKSIGTTGVTYVPATAITFDHDYNFAPLSVTSSATGSFDTSVVTPVIGSTIDGILTGDGTHTFSFTNGTNIGSDTFNTASGKHTKFTATWDGTYVLYYLKHID